MSIKISVDNNFFNAYDIASDGDKNKFMAACRNKQVSLYLTLDLMSELFALYYVNKPLLSKYSKILLELGNFRIFKQWRDIVLQELEILSSDGIYCNCSEVENIVKILRQLSLGLLVKNEVALKKLIEAVKNHKKQWFVRNKEEQGSSKESLKGSTVNKIKFGEFYSTNDAINIRKEAINTILGLKQIKFSDTKMDEIVINQNKYPYFHMASKIDAALFYFHNIKYKRVEIGDSWDTSYFVYLVGLDYFITEEKRLKEIGDIIFENVERVKNFSETLDKIYN